MKRNTKDLRSDALRPSAASLLPKPGRSTAMARMPWRPSAARLRRNTSAEEPSLQDTRALLEANLFHHDLITPEELELRHQNSIGRCFEQFVLRHAETQEQAGGGKSKDAVPLWQRLTELKMPLLLIYGREDRARAAERATLLQQRYPQLDLHFAEGCKHMVPWDAADLFHRLAVPFLTR